MTDERFQCHPFLAKIAQYDVAFLLERDKTYGGSWKKGGGKSAWYMLRRKMDRLIEMMTPPDLTKEISSSYKTVWKAATADDIFFRIKENTSGADSTILAEIRDLRRYLLLCEAEMYATGNISDKPDDENLHARFEDGA